MPAPDQHDDSGHDVGLVVDDVADQPEDETPQDLVGEPVAEPPLAPRLAPGPRSAARAAPALAHNLAVRRQAVQRRWPGTEVGWIGDASHQAEHSDHNPDATSTVHAIDVMLPLGARADLVVAQCLAHSGDLEYVIHNRVIWTRSRGWRAHRYTGSNPHTDHVHISGRHGSVGFASRTGTGYDPAATATTPAFVLGGVPGPVPPPRPVPTGARRRLRVTHPLMRGDDVRLVQRFIGAAKCGPADGLYGEHTAAGVRWYQGMRGIQVDGIVGPQTWAEMGFH